MYQNNNRSSLNQDAAKRHVLLRLSCGLKVIFHDARKAIAVIAYLITSYFVWLYRGRIFAVSCGIRGIDALLDGLLGLYIPFLAIALLFLLVMALGTPLHARKVENSLRRIGLVNHAGESPLLVTWTKEHGTCVTVLEFESCGIPKNKWEDKRLELEAVLNLAVVKIVEGNSRKRILMYTVQGNSMLPRMIHWQDSFISPNSFELVLGESLLGKETVNLAKIPHILLGGSTGSGKSILLKLLIMQCIKKGAIVYIADFKGGVDFSTAWSRYSKLIIEETALLDVLSDIVAELEQRKALFRSVGCADIDEYNRHLKDHRLRRIVIACDEVAEILNKTGLNKADKEQIASCENRLSVVARQGRAFGIHLILATQRPDANILTGQIRSNISFRICGRADNVLSQIILDSTAASDAISTDAQGRFITNDGTVFQGYMFNEKTAFTPKHPS